MKVVHFSSAAEFRRWLEANHAVAAELWVGFYNKASGRGGLTYFEALDQALCFGWIDGVRYKIDADSYTNLFTPRRSGSNWSLVNVRHVERLTKAGQMRPAGVAAYAARRPEKTGGYSFQNRPEKLPPAYERPLRANAAAWTFFSAQAPSYRRICAFWIVSAKQEPTRQRRLAQLIACSATARRIPPLAGPKRRA
jgi:uncharacterized protein YdeI (YjbR/CyaY-like superfamily)